MDPPQLAISKGAHLGAAIRRSCLKARPIPEPEIVRRVIGADVASPDCGVCSTNRGRIVGAESDVIR